MEKYSEKTDNCFFEKNSFEANSLKTSFFGIFSCQKLEIFPLSPNHPHFSFYVEIYENKIDMKFF